MNIIHIIKDILGYLSPSKTWTLDPIRMNRYELKEYRQREADLRKLNKSIACLAATSKFKDHQFPTSKEYRDWSDRYDMEHSR